MSINNVKLFIFILTLFVINSLNLKNNAQTKLSQSATGSIYVSVDNVLESITVNGKSIPLSGSLDDWTKTKTIQADIKPGDTISITGKNFGTWSDSNPAGIIATINYIDESGKTASINTGAKWTCDESPAWEEGANDASTKWSSVGQMKNIDGKAQWIWNSDKRIKSTCSVQIPQSHTSTGSIYVSVDNVLESITVNGKSIPLSGSLDDWTKTKTIQADIKPGDAISITGKNFGTWSDSNPAGIIATINYIDESGKTASINTGAKWTCDESPAWEEGANDASTKWSGVGQMKNIDGKAQWIWNSDKRIKSTCSVQIPKKNSLIYIAVDDTLESLTINGVAVDFSSDSIHVASANLTPGDIISITASNNGAWTDSNPAGILASIHYTDESGNQVILNTSDIWSCDGTVADLMGTNTGNSIWHKDGYHFDLIEGDAEWIWNPNHAQETTCYVTIPTNNSAIIYVTVDDILESIKVNGNEVPLNIPTDIIKEFGKTKVIQTQIAPGDSLSITGSNIGTWSEANPSGIIATIKYIDEKGNTTSTLNTNGNWTCDGVAALTMGTNSKDSVWVTRGHIMKQISPDANWIWNPNHQQTSTCSYTFPEPSKPTNTSNTNSYQPNGVIYVTAENSIDKVAVNGIDLKIPAKSDKWKVTKAIDGTFKYGDVITITASNTGETADGNPAALIATLNFTDETGKVVKVNTDSKWSCDSKPALVKGPNAGDTIWTRIKGGPLDNISSSAYWIWSSDSTSFSTTCTITIPKKKIRGCNEY